MPKPCAGTPTNNSDLIRESRAFCEGVQYRASGTSAAKPLSDNPHETGSDAADAWQTGWVQAQSDSGTTMIASDAPCCAIPHNTILA